MPIGEGIAVVMRRHGLPSVLTAEPTPIEPPGPGEILIRQTAVGLNFLDIYYRRGNLKPSNWPFINGFEGAGVVEEIGAGVTNLASGERVAYALEAGAYAEYRLLPANRAIKLPPDISDTLAAASLLKGMTAEYLVHRAYAVRPSDVVLVHAAAGGVGSLVCQWAKYKGATVLGAVSSPAKFDAARRHGCDHVVCYENWIEDVLSATSGLGPTVVYDGVGKATFLGSLSVLRPRGLCLAFGSASGNPDPLDVSYLNHKSLNVGNPGLQHYIETPDDLALSSSRLFNAIRDGAIRIDIGQRFSLRELDKAHELIESRQSSGSIIAEVA